MTKLLHLLFDQMHYSVSRDFHERTMMIRHPHNPFLGGVKGWR